jgi:predicted nucleotidyltransferase component of viral defense system
MNLSLEFLDRCAAETGFQQATLEKVIRLGELAESLTRHPVLGGVLALKGGTALNLCFGSPTRLSVDLDFNYVGHADREEMVAHRPVVHDAVLRLVERLGYHPQESPEGFAGGKIFLGYRSTSGTPDRVELDLNYLYRVPFSGTSSRNLWQPGGLDLPAIRVVGLPELLIGKLLAFLDRMAVRDVWDVANLPAPLTDLLGSVPFRKQFIAFSAVLPHTLISYSRERLERNVTEEALVDQLAPVLNRYVKIHLGDLVAKAWGVIEPFLQLETEEVEYFYRIANGEAHPELLFADDPSMAAQIASHPAIEWKIKNMREHRARQH